MRGARGIFVTSLIGLLALLLAAAALATDRQPVKSQLTLTSVTPLGAVGTLSTKQKACRAGRKVRLIIEPQGGGGESPNGAAPAIPVGSARTRPNGSWQTSTPLETGRRYFAQVFASHVGKFNCGFDTSDDLLLPGPTFAADR